MKNIAELRQSMTDVIVQARTIMNKAKDEVLKTYFAEVKTAPGLGAGLTREYAKKSKDIGKHLVACGVAFSDADVNTVLLTGFFHAYGPINEYLD